MAEQPLRSSAGIARRSMLWVFGAMARAHPSKPDDQEILTLIRAIARGEATAIDIITASPALVQREVVGGATRDASTAWYFTEIEHYVYAGDTALHVAAAAYRPDMVRRLIAHGALICAKNRRGAEPLHYAADGGPNSTAWNPAAQAATVTCLIEAGADPNALDKSGVGPLHRAVRCRCSAAVRALLAGGANPTLTNKNGSTPLALATRTTGRGGSGSPEARREQFEIIRLLQQP